MHESKVEGLVITPRLEASFWSRVEKVPGGCWLWHGGIAADGYGVVHLPVEGATWTSGKAKKKAIRAHRLAWRLVKGVWPPEHMPSGAAAILLHSCDVRNCVKVLESADESEMERSHLSPGTHAENSADMASKGRAMSGDMHYARLEPDRAVRGEAVGTAKLDESKVAIIKGEIALAPKSAKTGKPLRGVYARLAEHFGVTNVMIMYIAQGKWWSHVPPATITESILPTRVTARAHNARITEAMALEIHKLSAQGMTGAQLAIKFALSQPSVSAVLTGRKFGDLPLPASFDSAEPLKVDRRHETMTNAKLTEDVVREIRACLKSGEKRASIAARYAAQLGVSTKAIFDLLRGTTWKHVQDVPT